MTVPLSSSWKFKKYPRNNLQCVQEHPALAADVSPHIPWDSYSLVQALNSRSIIVLQTNFSFKIFHSFLATLCLICTLCGAGDSVHTSQGTGEKASLWNQRWMCISKEFIFGRKKMSSFKPSFDQFILQTLWVNLSDLPVNFVKQYFHLTMALLVWLFHPLESNLVIFLQKSLIWDSESVCPYKHSRILLKIKWEAASQTLP